MTEKVQNNHRRRNNGRRPDRRTLLTREIIRRSFILLVNRKPYSKITVAQVCRQAMITRSTFYFHFRSLQDLLDSVLDRALQFSQESNNSGDQQKEERNNGDAAEFQPQSSSFSAANADQLIPACQRAAGKPEYRALLMDPDLSEHIIARIAAHEEGRVVPKIRRLTGLNEQDARTLFLYMIHGSFAINKRHGFIRDSQWRHEAALVDRFVSGGYRAFLFPRPRV